VPRLGWWRSRTGRSWWRAACACAAGAGLPAAAAAAVSPFLRVHWVAVAKALCARRVNRRRRWRAAADAGLAGLAGQRGLVRHARATAGAEAWAGGAGGLRPSRCALAAVLRLNIS
jgi:hypothetical protein